MQTNWLFPLALPTCSPLLLLILYHGRLACTLAKKSIESSFKSNQIFQIESMFSLQWRLVDRPCGTRWNETKGKLSSYSNMCNAVDVEGDEDGENRDLMLRFLWIWIMFGRLQTNAYQPHLGAVSNREEKKGPASTGRKNMCVLRTIDIKTENKTPWWDFPPFVLCFVLLTIRRSGLSWLNLIPLSDQEIVSPVLNAAWFVPSFVSSIFVLHDRLCQTSRYALFIQWFPPAWPVNAEAIQKRSNCSLVILATSTSRQSLAELCGLVSVENHKLRLSCFRPSRNDGVRRQWFRIEFSLWRNCPDIRIWVSRELIVGVIPVI